MNDFQESLQELMLEKSLNRSQLSRLTGISTKTIDGYFNYNYLPDIKIALKLSKFFDCSLNYLFGLSTIKNESLSKNTKTFFETLKFLINENKVSIARVFKDLKMSRTSYYSWEKGDFPRTQNIIEIAKYFNCSVDFLVGNLEK